MNGLLLWDIDGTLILGTGVSGRALARFFEQRYGWRDVGRAIRPYGMTDPRIVDGIFEYFGEEPRNPGPANRCSGWQCHQG